MRVLLLGVGMQGRAALHHLARSDAMDAVVAADRDLATLERLVADRGYGPRVETVAVDAGDGAALRRLVHQGFDVVVELLPVDFVEPVVRACVAAGVHLVSTMYASEVHRRLDPVAADRDVALLPELGMDPGIDLVLLAAALRDLDRVESIRGYGSGIPEPAAADNPLRYKISWSFDGVLRTYRRPARVVRDGELVEVPADELFASENLHTVEVGGIGEMEAFPNEDIVPFLDRLGLDPGSLRDAGRYTLRYPGHAAFWRKIVALHLLDDEPVMLDGRQVDRREYLAAALEPRLQYRESERDLALVRVEVTGRRGGDPVRIVHEVLDHKDLETRLSAMSRLVGFSASIGAQMLGSGEIEGRGLLSPLTAVPVEPFLARLEAEGVQVRARRD